MGNAEHLELERKSQRLEAMKEAVRVRAYRARAKLKRVLEKIAKGKP